MKKIIISASLFAGLLLGTQISFAQNISDGDLSNDTCVSLQTSILRFRSTDATAGGDISELQDFLIAKGMLTGSPTGFYGRLTVNAVKAYQRQMGVSPTGNVGPLTKGIIEKETCGQNYIPPVAVPQTSQPTIRSISVATNNTMLIYGNNLNAVNSFSNGRSSLNIDNGKFGIVIRDGLITIPNISTALKGSFVDNASFEVTLSTNDGYMSNTVPTSIPAYPVACTMEYRLCPDGSAMPREANCTWRNDKCSTNNLPVISSQNTPYISSVNTIVHNNTLYVTVLGVNFENVTKITQERLADGTSEIKTFSKENNKITASIPITGNYAGKVTFTLYVSDGKASNSSTAYVNQTFMASPPSITSAQVLSDSVGKTLLIQGKNFLTVTAVCIEFKVDGTQCERVFVNSSESSVGIRLPQISGNVNASVWVTDEKNNLVSNIVQI